jgi:hypothetical protein
VSRIINLGAQAVGIMNIYLFNNQLITVNKFPYSTPGSGSISVVNLNNNTFTNVLLARNVNTGAGINGHLLYFGYNYGIGSLNLETLQMEDTSIVSDPGSAMFRYITSATVDTLNDRLYTNTGDYLSPGICLVTNLAGDSITSYATGISTDVVTVHQRTAATGMAETGRRQELLNIWPNPARDIVNIRWSADEEIEWLQIKEVTGNIIPEDQLVANGNDYRLDISKFRAGMYFITIKSPGRLLNGKFIVL